MTMTRKPLKKRGLKIVYTKKARKIKNKKWSNIFYTILMYSILFFIVSGIIWTWIIYNKYIVWLPSVNELQNLEIAESSIIYDRDGNELYKIFKEKRTYVPFEDINKDMINAIIAIEDKRYWQNPWVDIQWIARAWINYVLWKTATVKWTSTLTQQLIRNTIITSERSVERKIKEIFLAYKLTSSISKEKILELYLNKISYGHNAFWIEEAAKTFFSKSSKDIDVLESSILASLPKWPTFYSPYNHPTRVLGYPYIYTKENQEEITKIITAKDKIINEEMLSKFTNLLEELKFSRLQWTNKWLICNLKNEYFKNPIKIDNDWCSIIEYSKLLYFLNSIRISEEDNYIEYQTWRKDEVLWRMLEDWYIDFDTYIWSILRSIWFEFSESRENIKSPHFVFYVKEYLEEKFWKEIISVWWLKIYTTLDPNLQAKAEELVQKQVEINTEKYEATNAALISIDNKTWEILSMVGWKDYFDKENNWNVNIITSKLQPWSTFKPFVYSLGVLNEQIWTKTPIYDLETEFPSEYIPANFDGEFMWKMDISTALNNSRNIPAIKMFFMAWWERKIVNFLRDLWTKSLRYHGMYWAPLALWTWEMTPLELATAYSVFANMWEKKDITPILKIVDSKWNIVEELIIKDKTEDEDSDESENQVMPKAQAYIINSILSDTDTRPAFWNTILSLKDRIVAAKTGTSTKQYMKDDEKDIYPSNLWTAWYTPQITTVVWAWNTKWEKLNYKWNWLEWAWPIWRDFMEYAHKGKASWSWLKPEEVEEIHVSQISWLLPSPDMWNQAVVKSLFINKPVKYDNSNKQVQVDLLCNWVVSSSTPKDAIKTVTLIWFNSIDPNDPDWQDPVNEWTKSDDFKEKYWELDHIVTDISDQECERSWVKPHITIRTTLNDDDTLIAWENYVELAYRSNQELIKIEVLIDNIVVDEIDTKNRKSWSYIWNIFIPISHAHKRADVTFKAISKEYYSGSVKRNVFIIKKDTSAPSINLVKPASWNIKIYENNYFNLKANIQEVTSLRTINIKIDWKLVKSGITERNIVFPINKDTSLSVWKHIVTIEAIDENFNKAVKNVNLEILAR